MNIKSQLCQVIRQIFFRLDYNTNVEKDQFHFNTRNMIHLNNYNKIETVFSLPEDEYPHIKCAMEKIPKSGFETFF